MAITVRTYNINSGNPFWNTNDVLDALQTALADIGYHAPSQTGTILTFTNSAGTTIAAEKGKRYLVRQSSTNGSGQYATFDIVRNSATGAIATVTLVNGGINYAIANTLTIQGSLIGGVNTTDDLTITVSTVSGSQGSTTTWYDADTASPYTWGVCCVNIDQTKKMGQTYYAFSIPAITAATLSPTLYIRSGPGFQSNTNVFNGVAGLDFVSAATVNSTTQQHFSQVIASSNAVPLTLTTYQSAIDTKFVMFQFSEQTQYGKLYRWPFFLSNYNSATQPWSLDDCFTGGVYQVNKLQNTTTYDTQVGTWIATAPMAKRQGEWGYNGLQGVYSATTNSLWGAYESVFGNRYVSALLKQYPVIYQRTRNDLIHTAAADYNPVITGIPICNIMIPCPYFLPADFGITEVVGTNAIEYGDLISVGATTKWRVLQYGSNQGTTAFIQTYNSALGFVGKTVD